MKRKSDDASFEQRASGASSTFLGEFAYFLRHNKKWWVTPVMVLLLLLGLLVVVGGSGAAPFIYALF